MSKAVAGTMRNMATKPGMIGIIAALILLIMAMAELMVE